jgi:hypothetical protein
MGWIGMYGMGWHGMVDLDTKGIVCAISFVL